jgi:N6-adenosine-specific RNA methylase IME4
MTLTPLEIQPANPFRLELPDGVVFNTIYADPPWPMDQPNTVSHRRRIHYDRMSANEILDMGEQIKLVTTEDAHLWLWTTNAHLPLALKVVEAWGFTYKTLATWRKSKLGQGWWLRSRTEHLILAARSTNLRHNPGSWDTEIKGTWRGHSKKPPVYDRIEALSPGPYLELFSREAKHERENWNAVGQHSTPADPFGQHFKHPKSKPDANDGIVRGVGGLEIRPGRPYKRLEKVLIAKPVKALQQKGRRVQIEIEGEKKWVSIDTLRPNAYKVPVK